MTDERYEEEKRRLMKAVEEYCKEKAKIDKERRLYMLKHPIRYWRWRRSPEGMLANADKYWLF